MKEFGEKLLAFEKLKDQLAVYVVSDERPDMDGQLRAIEQALQGGATTVQLRRKQDDGRVLVEMGRRIRDMTLRYQALYFVNDRVDIAMLTNADGVHVGQSDISCQDVRRIVGNKLIGVSAATVEEARTAVSDGADYLGVGSVFPTQSKPDADLCGLTGLQSITSEVTEIPIVAIGGITVANAPEVLAAGADGLAVVSAIMQAHRPAEVSQQFAKLVASARQVTR